MCADFRVKCEVEVRGLTSLFLYAAYRRHAVSPVPRRGHLRKALGNIVESAVLPYPRFSVRGQSIAVFTTRPDDPRQPRSFVWEERGRRAGRVRTKRADNVEVPKLLRTFAMIETYGN